MKAKKFLIVFIIPWLIGFTSDQNLLLPGDTPVALVKKIVKDVSYKKAGQSDWDLAKTGDALFDGGQVKTGSKSLALVLFTDGSGLLKVRENAVLNIYGQRNNKQIDKNTYIDKGLIGFEVNKQEDAEFKFTTPTAVASIRGTLGFIEVGSDSSTTISLENGSVEIQALRGNRGSGRVTGGNTARIDPLGNVNLNAASDEDRKKNSATRQLTTKKVKIKTPQGDLEIEYYSTGNN